MIGQRLEFTGAGDNDVYRVVGVMPESFAFGEAVDLWRPTNIIELPVSRGGRNWRYDRVIARLRAGTTIEHVRAELDPYPHNSRASFLRAMAGGRVTVESLHES